MIYKNLLHLTDLADDLISYIESDTEENRKSSTLSALIFLFEIERLFDQDGRGLFSDESNFDLESASDPEWQDAHTKIERGMDKIRSKMEELVNKYGKENFKLAYDEMRNDGVTENWIAKILQS